MSVNGDLDITLRATLNLFIKVQETKLDHFNVFEKEEDLFTISACIQHLFYGI